MRKSRAYYQIPTPPVVTTLELERENAYLVSTLPPASMLQEWSKEINGSVSLGNYYFNHTSGHHTETYILPTQTNPITGEVTNHLEKIYSARETVRKIVGPKSKFYDAPGWTFPKMARNICEWLNIQTEPIDEMALLVEPWHYTKCYPDHYDQVYMYDMTAAYWQMVERAPSPYFVLWKGKIDWQPIAREQQTRWDRLRRAFRSGNDKRLRLAIVGASMAGWDRKKQNDLGEDVFDQGIHVPSQRANQFCHGKVKDGNKPGDLQPLALLAVRCTYELCQIQSMISESVYSNADCVCTETQGPMSYWDNFGIKYKLKAQGMADIRAMQSYKIGEVFTAKYPGDVMRERQWGEEPNNLTDTTWHTQLLGG